MTVKTSKTRKRAAAPPKPLTLAERLEAAEQLIDGQRRDFDALAQVLGAKDQQFSNMDADVRSQGRLLNTAAEQLNRITTGFNQLQGRVTAYESQVPAIARVRRAIDAKAVRDAQRAVANGGGISQKEWPFGPAPIRECSEGREHQWQLIGYFDKVSPPIPSFGCSQCKWLWTRQWTQAEFTRWLAQQNDETQKRFAKLSFPESPPYAGSSASSPRAVPKSRQRPHSRQRR